MMGGYDHVLVATGLESFPKVATAVLFIFGDFFALLCFFVVLVVQTKAQIKAF
jgi:hypothetical protein